jgi:hypothetical protein
VRHAGLLVLVLPVALWAGCGFLTDVEKLESFQFEELEGMTTDTVEVNGVPGAIFVLGQINTPTRCYALRGELEEKDRSLTLRVSARSTATTCAADGAFRYQAVLRPLEAGTYDVRIIHSFPSTNRPTQEFREDVVVR